MHNKSVRVYVCVVGGFRVFELSRFRVSAQQHGQEIEKGCALKGSLSLSISQFISHINFSKYFKSFCFSLLN